MLLPPPGASCAPASRPPRTRPPTRPPSPPPPLLQSTINATDVNAFAVAVVEGSLSTDQKKTTDVAATCGSGRYGVMVGNFKVCALCASGTSGDGYGCTACDAGTAAAVGATSCSNCAAGSYAQGGEWQAHAASAAQIAARPPAHLPAACGCCDGSPTHLCPPWSALMVLAGNSDCLPCPSGTYSSTASASECTEW